MFEKNKKKKYPGVSAIFWIIFALILLILFLVNKNRIFSVLQTTGFFSKVFGTEPEFIVNHTSDEENEPVAELESIQDKNITAEIETSQAPIVLNAIAGDGSSASSSAKPVDNKASSQEQTAAKDAQPASSTTAGSSTTNTPAALKESTTDAEKKETASSVVDSSGSEAPATTAQMKQHLFFIEIDSEGSVLRKETVRSIAKTTTPLTAAITALLEGPDLNEVEKGYITLIPQGTKLLGASVKNGTATINFSDAFRYNQYGVEGYYGQLMQIVYTASAFSNINNVQFLIEGEKMDYLGLEGVFIGAPLSIASFH
ncbi:MAG: GerMN domain-containing protein [Treponemataceae bacterium]|nr:GerMN domain-containing protein [Treponemataceae bacterium]